MKKTKITLVLLALLMFCMAGCAKAPAPVGSANPSAAPAPAKTAAPAPSAAPEYMNVAVYYPKTLEGHSYLVREIHKVIKTEGVAKAALQELISGKILTVGAARILPENAKILGIKINDGIATVDFSKEVLSSKVSSEMQTLGLASIVNTLTEYPTITKVQCTVDGSAENAKDWWGHGGFGGKPMERNINNVYEPVIWATAPLDGQVVSSPLTVRGTASIFESTVNYRLKDSSGKVLVEDYTMANSGAPNRGDFEIVLKYTAKAGEALKLELFEASAKDGSDINKVIIDLKNK